MILEENLARHLNTKYQHDGPGHTFAGMAHKRPKKLSQMVDTSNCDKGLQYSFLFIAVPVSTKNKIAVIAGGVHLSQPFPHLSLHAQENALLSPAKSHKSERTQYLSLIFIFKNLFLLTIHVNFQFVKLINFFVWIFITNALFKRAIYNYP